MTTVKMRRIWDWMAARLVDPPEPPKFKVSLWFLPREAAGLYRRGTLIVRPWSDRTHVIHEGCHYLWDRWDVGNSPEGGRFLQAVRRGRWDQPAVETWCATLTAILVDRPGVWKRPVSGVTPCRAAVWTFTPFLKEKP